MIVKMTIREADAVIMASMDPCLHLAFWQSLAVYNYFGAWGVRCMVNASREDILDHIETLTRTGQIRDVLT